MGKRIVHPQRHQARGKGTLIYTWKNAATVQFLKRKYKVVTSASDKRRITRVSTNS